MPYDFTIKLGDQRNQRRGGRSQRFDELGLVRLPEGPLVDREDGRAVGRLLGTNVHLLVGHGCFAPGGRAALSR